MSGARIEIARRGYDAWNRGDLEAFTRLLAPDLEYRPSGRFPGFDPVYRGRAGFMRFAETMLEAWEEFTIAPGDFVEFPDGLVIPIRFHGKGRGSGVEVALDFAHVVRFRPDGLIATLHSHESWEEALEDAGLG